MKKLKNLLLIMLAICFCLPGNISSFALAEDDFTLLYAIPSVSNPYEQTLNTFTLSYCLPAQMLNQSPEITDCEADPNGLTWVIFVFEHGVVQLMGKDSQGKWKCATWSNVGSTDMLFICYCLCKAFGTVYKDNTDFDICLYSDSGDHSYIGNKASADSFIQMIDNEYGNTAEQEQSGNVSNKIARGTNDPVLSLFPGIEWGMGKSNMISQYGSDKIMDISDKEHNICISMVDIYDEGVFISFSFTDDKLDMITAIYSEEKTELYMADMMKDYGKPVRTSSIYAYMDEIKEVANGDVAVWMTDNTKITIVLSGAGSVTYRPL